MLYLISMGIWDEKDLSLRGLEAAKKCDEVYAEFYTTTMNTDAAKLSKITGKTVTELKRGDLEENSGKILQKAKNKDIAILVGGDALTATTHVSLLMDARKMGIRTRVIHGSSVLTAIGETGLQLYKFGKATTLSRDFPKSCHETILQNRKAGLHTLVLLEPGMDALDGLETLLKRLKPSEKAVFACHLGGSAAIKHGEISDLLKNRRVRGKAPAVIIIPGRLHFMEKEFLDAL
jgi:diphthine synthase